MPRAASNKVTKKAPTKVPKKATSSVASVLRQQATQSAKRHVVRKPQHRPAPRVLSPRTKDAYRYIRDQARLEVLQGACLPQTTALDLSVGVPPMEFSDSLNVSFLMASFVSDEAALLNLSEQVLEALGTPTETVIPSAAAVPLVAPAVHEIEDDGATLDETSVTTPSTSSGSSLGLSGNATDCVIVDDEDDDITVIELAEDLPVSGPDNALIEQLLLESPEQETNNSPSSFTEDILVAELSRVANRKTRPIPLMLDYRDHYESSDRIRKVREAYPPQYVNVYQGLNPPYAQEKRIPERKPPFLSKLISFNSVFYLDYPWSVRHGHCGMCSLGRSIGLETVQELRACRPIPGNPRFLLDLALSCPNCGEVFLLPGLLQLHIENLHAGSGWDGPAQICPNCQTASYYP